MKPFALLALLSLAACAPQAQTPEKTPEEAPAETAGGLESIVLATPLRALGTEPFWAVEITSDALVHTGVDRPERRAPHSGPQISQDRAVWSATTETGEAFSVVLKVEDCSDGMSDRTYPLSAEVQIGDDALKGCAASVSWLESVDENGNPRP